MARPPFSVLVFAVGIFLYLSVLQGGVWAEVWTVCPSGCNYTSVQGGIDAASPGDILVVGSGTYTENIVVDKPLNLVGMDSVVVNALDSKSPAMRIDADWTNVSGFTLTGATKSDGVLINASWCNLSGNNVSDNKKGISFDTPATSLNNIVSHNFISGNQEGVEIEHSGFNVITQNTITGNGFKKLHAGISIEESSHNTISYNNLVGNHNGVVLKEGACRNDVTGNFISTSTSTGVVVTSSNNNTFWNNTVTDNDRAIELGRSYYNLIYHNNFINSISLQASDDGNNTWDTGYPLGGNYWSDWTSPDDNADGVVDSPYTIFGGSNKDSYPVTTQDGWLGLVDDTTPPAITLHSPLNTTYTYSGTSVLLNVSTSELAAVTYSLNGASNLSLYNFSTQGSIMVTAAEGSNQLTVQAVDAAGNLNSAILYFTVQGFVDPEVAFDRTLDGPKTGNHKVPPTTLVEVTITGSVSGPVENAVLKDYVPKDFTIIDSYGGAIMEYDSGYNVIEWSNGAVNGNVTRSYLMFTPERTSPPTKYHFRSELSYNGGNKTSEWWMVTVADPDNIPPDITIHSPGNTHLLRDFRPPQRLHLGACRRHLLPERGF
jgi:parallel beta-helix repeat protein